MRIILTPDEVKSNEKLVRAIMEFDGESNPERDIWEIPDRYKNIVSINREKELIVIIDVNADMLSNVTDEVTGLLDSIVPVAKSLINLFSISGRRIKSIIGKYIQTDKKPE